MSLAESPPNQSATRRGRFAPRFGLRTLLLVVTACCVFLAFGLYPAREYTIRKARAKALIESWGGKVEPRGAELRPSPGANWLSLKFGYGEPQELLWAVQVAGSNFTVEQCQLLSQCRWIRSLDVWFSNIDDAALGEIAKNKELYELRLPLSLVTDAGLSQLKSVEHLYILDVSGTKVTYAGLADLEQAFPGSNFREQRALPEVTGFLRQNPWPASDVNLRQMIGLSPSPPAADVIEIKSATESCLTPKNVDDLRRLQSALGFDSQGAVFPAGGLGFLRDLQRLEWVIVRDGKTASLTDDDLRVFAGLPKLERLELAGRQLTDAGIGNLAPCADKLQSLVVKGDLLTPAVFEQIAKLTALRFVDIEMPLTAENRDVFREQLRRLASLPKLESLNIACELPIDDIAAILADVPPIEIVRIRRLTLSAADWRRLKDVRPELSIEWQADR